MENSGQMSLAITLPEEAFTPPDRELRECRICLAESDNPLPSEFVEPCRCSGSMRFVHFKCLAQWIERSQPQLLSQSSARKQYTCEMCTQKIKFQCKYLTECQSAQTVCLKIKSGKILFIFLMVLIVSCLVLIMFLAAMLGNPAAFGVSGAFANVIFSTAIVVLAGLFFLLLYVLVIDFLIKSTSLISQIHNYRSQSRQKRKTESPNKSEQTMLNQTRYTGSRTVVHPEMMLNAVFE